jgi:transcriptional regulator with XRE-family HTH domain
METTPGQLLRDARKRRGVSQKRLAIRAGTTQSAISRIEQDRISPTIETLERLLHLLGEELVMGARESDSGVDRSMVHERFKLTPADRLEYGRRFAQYVIDHSPNARSKTAA